MAGLRDVFMGCLCRARLHGQEHDGVSTCGRRTPGQCHQRQTRVNIKGGRGISGWVLRGNCSYSLSNCYKYSECTQLLQTVLHPMSGSQHKSCT